MRIIKKFEGDGGSLLLVMLQKGKKYYVNVVTWIYPIVNQPKIITRWFLKRDNAEKYYQKVKEEF